jgi:transcriptional regulator with XRE-family HTH domain
MKNLIRLPLGRKSASTLAPVSERVAYFLRKTGLTEAEFARQTGVKQQVCNQILRGQTSNPRVETLVRFAQFFEVTLGQLVGTEPMSEYPHKAASCAVPLLKWNDVLPWVTQEILPLGNTSQVSWISCDLMPGLRAYAIRSNPSLEPYFDRNSVLVVDPTTEEYAGQFVVVSLDGKTVTVRRLVEDLGVRFLNSIVPGLPARQLEPKHQILGTVAEIRINLNSNRPNKELHS